MDEPLVLAASLLVPFALGLLLRLKGAFVAAVALAAYAAWAISDLDDPAQVVGAAVLGAIGGFALGWAGSLTRRVLRRRD